MQEKKFTTYRIVFVGVMAAMICVVTAFRFPLFGSKIHFGNTLCLLGGLLFGGLYGGLSAGIGSMLNDLLIGGYGFLESLVTLVTKFLMGFTAGALAYGGGGQGRRPVRNIVACVSGALLYVALYMLKTLIFKRFLDGYLWEATWVAMGSKLPASLINAGFAIVAAPLLHAALRPALVKAKVLE